MCLSLSSRMSKNNQSMALPELPDDIEQKIVLSLPPKAFARASVLSKSWRSFYNSTRCRLNFNCQCPLWIHEEEIMNFEKFLSPILLREKVVVDRFDIYIERYKPQFEAKLSEWLTAVFATDNIVKELYVHLPTHGRQGPFSVNYCLPPEIFFNESLQVLHLDGCRLDTELFSNRQTIINLVHLRVLSLSSFVLDSKTIERLFRACPFVEKCTLNSYAPLQCIQVKGLHKLKMLDIEGSGHVRIIEAPALQKLRLRETGYFHRSSIHSRLCRSIKYLEMDVFSDRTARHIQQTVSDLPELEDLNLNMLICTDHIRISSRSLKNLKLTTCLNHNLEKVQLDVPNLRSYEYESKSSLFAPHHLMMNASLLEMVIIHLRMKIHELNLPELRNALRMIGQLNFGVQPMMAVSREEIWILTSRSDQRVNVPPARIVQMLNVSGVHIIDGMLHSLHF